MKLNITYKEFERHFNVQPEHTVEELYIAVANDLKIEVSSFSLYYHAGQLVNDRTSLEDRGLRNESHLLVFLFDDEEEESAPPASGEQMDMSSSVNAEEPTIVYLLNDDGTLTELNSDCPERLNVITDSTEEQDEVPMETVFESLVNEPDSSTTTTNDNSSDNSSDTQLPCTSSSSSSQKVKGHNCGICNKWFRKKSDLNVHSKSHQNVNEFRCYADGCGRECKTASSFRSHFRNHRGQVCDLQKGRDEMRKVPQQQSSSTPAPQKNFLCDFQGCTKSYKAAKALTKHKKSHLGKKTYKCTICGHECNIDMKNHYKVHALTHPHVKYDVKKCKNEATNPSNNYEKREFPCDKCPMVCRTAHLLTKHLEVGHKQWICGMCKKEFSSKYYLGLHKSLHNPEPTHSCPQCDRKFVFKKTLQNHVRRDHGNVRFICHVCVKNFTAKSHLKVHIDNIHNKIRHPCYVCSKTFCTRQSLRRHQKVHRKFDPVTCGVCQKTFLSSVCYQNHLILNKKSPCGQTVEGVLFLEKWKQKKYLKTSPPPLTDPEKEALQRLLGLCEETVNVEKDRYRKRVKTEDSVKEYSHIMVWPCHQKLSEEEETDEGGMTVRKCEKVAICHTKKRIPQWLLRDLMKKLLKLKGCFSILAHIRQELIHEMDVMAAEFIIKCRYFVIAKAIKRMITEFSRPDNLTNVTRFYPLFSYGEDVYRFIAEKIVQFNLVPLHVSTGIPLTIDELETKIKGRMTDKLQRLENVKRGLRKIVMRNSICTFEKKPKEAEQESTNASSDEPPELTLHD